MAIMGAMALWCVWRIDPSYIDYSIARGEVKNNQGKHPGYAGKRTTVYANKSLLVIAFIQFFFHLGNAALLPLLGQSAAARFDINPAAYTAFTVILAQSTMIVTAIWAARTADRSGYAHLFYLALLSLPIRGAIAGLWLSPWHLIPVQLLDGVGACLLGVATPGIIARILQGTGHINMGLGLVMTIQGVGAALSNTYGGLSAHLIGYSGAFLALGAAPVIGLILFSGGSTALPDLRHTLACMPEADTEE